MTEAERAVFFREATLRLCGRLSVHEALGSLFDYLQGLLPVDRIFLECVDAGAVSMRTVAEASSQGCWPKDDLTTLSKAALVELEARDPFDADCLVFDGAGADRVTQEMFDFHSIPHDAAGLLMMLGPAQAPVGQVVFISLQDRYTQAHAELLRPLKQPFTIALCNTLEHREVLRLKNLLADDKRYLQRELETAAGGTIIGADQGLKATLKAARQVAATDSAVLLRGETGTGKDLIAHNIHRSSRRKDGPFITMNCGAIPDALIDTELFGHEKGAFTGAQGLRRGRFERAEGGTLFLDEVGELSPAAQVRLLRALQNKEIERVGGQNPVKVDVRIIAATHRSLEEMVREGSFREDLWYRLNVFPIEIPALRQRPEDIPALVRHFVDTKSQALKLGPPPALATGAVGPLLDYAWPGNVRELEHVVERALIITQGEALSFDAVLAPAAASEPRDRTLQAVERHHIRRVVQSVNGRIEGPDGAALILGLNPSTLRSRMRKLGITKA